MTRYFNTVVGNPPYNEDFNTGGNKRYARPLYHHFINLSMRVGGYSLLVTPARFLFDAGSTPKEWNHRMLNDPHLSVLDYYPNSMKVFPGINITSGISIISYNNDKENEGGAIKVFIPEPTLKTIYQKVACKIRGSLSSIVSPRTSYHLSEYALLQHPEIKRIVAKHREHDIKTNAFDKLDDIIYYFCKPCDRYDYVRLLGLAYGKRTYRWVPRAYLRAPKSFEQWKVFIPKAAATGNFGKRLASPVIGEPYMGATDTFLTIGGFDTREEAEACCKYVKTRFCRVLLNILKRTQDATRGKWKYVPLQDFTDHSFINWSKPVQQIDQQLYKYYGLTVDEQQWIESHVAAME